MSPISRPVQRYYRLMQDLDDWFAAVLEKHRGRMQCRRGCALCCHGLFDISLADARMVSEGIAALPESVRDEAARRAGDIQRAIQALAPGLVEPCLLSGADVDRIVAGAPNARCPLLDQRDECLIYRHRPLACRLEGVPMADARDSRFGDWCELNFASGLTPEDERTLVLDYCGIQDLEDAVSEVLAQGAAMKISRDATIFIPSLIAGFDQYWKARPEASAAP